MLKCSMVCRMNLYIVQTMTERRKERRKKNPIQQLKKKTDWREEGGGMRLREEAMERDLTVSEEPCTGNSVAFCMGECSAYWDTNLALEQQGTIAALIFKGVEEKWAGHVTFVKCLRWTHCWSISHILWCVWPKSFDSEVFPSLVFS